jgi:hypothetical protein
MKSRGQRALDWDDPCRPVAPSGLPTRRNSQPLVHRNPVRGVFFAQGNAEQVSAIRRAADWDELEAQNSET